MNLNDTNILTNQTLEGYQNEISKLTTDFSKSNRQEAEFATCLVKKIEAIETD
ncbi:hypothetical protein PFDG_05237 [Plasmodium falciparum Dd2]|uniref:Uncharacterized protein n=1 Tax=Plasmodium falciparum (isolate Dd2) TaxID=57267 RepID=A0A0L7MA00_PLAF4|nr:hypothetical protein PFDG_05237 [Plasmodium falciparum Dd2]